MATELTISTYLICMHPPDDHLNRMHLVLITCCNFTFVVLYFVSYPPVIASSVRSVEDQESKMKTDKSEDTSGQRADKTLG